MVNMTDIMIDLETLGNTPECVVISIGAVIFDPYLKDLGPTFYGNLKAQDQMNKGRLINEDTIKFWMNQSDAAKRVFSEQSTDPFHALSVFSRWITENVKDSKKRMVWGNGSTFDISILESIFRTYNIEIPWAYNSIMDLRTFKRFVGGGESIPKVYGVAHNALDDAINQAKYVSSFNFKVGSNE